MTDDEHTHEQLQLRDHVMDDKDSNDVKTMDYKHRDMRLEGTIKIVNRDTSSAQKMVSLPPTSCSLRLLLFRVHMADPVGEGGIWT